MDTERHTLLVTIAFFCHCRTTHKFMLLDHQTVAQSVPSNALQPAFYHLTARVFDFVGVPQTCFHKNSQVSTQPAATDLQPGSFDRELNGLHKCVESFPLGRATKRVWRILTVVLG